MLIASFWESFLLLLIFLPLALLWGFALIDVFRRDDIGGGAKAAWIALVILFPLIGTLIYVVVRPPGATPGERRRVEAGAQQTVRRTTYLTTMSDLHDRGKLTDDEYRTGKARVLDTIDTRQVIV